MNLLYEAKKSKSHEGGCGTVSPEALGLYLLKKAWLNFLTKFLGLT